MPVLTKINTNVIADNAITAAKTASSAEEESGLGLNTAATGNLTGTISTQQLQLADAFTLTGDLTVNDDLVLGKVRDDGTGQSITGDGKTLTGTGTLTMGSSLEGGEQLGREKSIGGLTGELGSAVTGSPALNLGNFTGVVPVGVTGGTGLTGAQTLRAAQIWRIHTSATGDVNPIINWERDDTSGAGALGTNMSESSGIFTFPYTGIWLIEFNCQCHDAGSNSSRYIEGSIHRTLNNSSYAEMSRGTGCMNSIDGNSDYMNTHASWLFDVDNLTNEKVKFSVAVHDNDLVLHGTTEMNFTWVTFLRISDTQGGG